jgi:hypothetical protein
MTARALDILSAIRRNGGDIRLIAPDRLKVVAPATLLPDFVEQARAVKSDLLAALATNAPSPETTDHVNAPDEVEARRWRERFTARTFEWSSGKREWQKGRGLAWGDMLNEWHSLHGRRWPAWQCAGCEKLIGGLEPLNLPDGNRVHFEPIDCLISFGRRWRSDAQAALTALGLEVPTGEESGS